MQRLVSEKVDGFHLQSRDSEDAVWVCELPPQHPVLPVDQDWRPAEGLQEAAALVALVCPPRRGQTSEEWVKLRT